MKIIFNNKTRAKRKHKHKHKAIQGKIKRAN